MPRVKRKLTLLHFILLGIVLGGFSGWFFGAKMLAVAWMGEMFLNALKMLVIPLIVSSLIVGVSGMGDITKVGRTGAISVIYFMGTTAIAVMLGMVIVNIIQPGVGVSLSETVPERVAGKTETGITDILKSFVTPNLIVAMGNMDILPIIIFSLVFGGVLTTMGDKGQTVILFFDAVNDAIMKMVHLVMYFAPIGIFALIASKLGAAGGGDAFFAELAKIGGFAVTVITALLIQAVVVLPLILVWVTRKNPIQFFKNVSPALTTAFSTASSSATLPVTLECAVEENKISPQTCKFVLPVAATVNMNGTALYESVAAIFIAQMVGVPLGFGEQAIIFLTATLAAIGAAGIPEAGLVTMVLVLQSVGLPLEGIGVLLSIDWFLDRCRTTVNVWGDSIGVAVVEQLEKRKVKGG